MFNVPKSRITTAIIFLLVEKYATQNSYGQNLVILVETAVGKCSWHWDGCGRKQLYAAASLKAHQAETALERTHSHTRGLVSDRSAR